MLWEMLEKINAQSASLRSWSAQSNKRRDYEAENNLPRFQQTRLYCIVQHWCVSSPNFPIRAFYFLALTFSKSVFHFYVPISKIPKVLDSSRNFQKKVLKNISKFSKSFSIFFHGKMEFFHFYVPISKIPKVLDSSRNFPKKMFYSSSPPLLLLLPLLLFKWRL